MGTGNMFDFLNTMVLNTNKYNLTENKMMISDHDLYLVTITNLVQIHVYPPHLPPYTKNYR